MTKEKKKKKEKKRKEKRTRLLEIKCEWTEENRERGREFTVGFLEAQYIALKVLPAPGLLTWSKNKNFRPFTWLLHLVDFTEYWRFFCRR
jgi:hypothetical protein